MFDHQKTKVGAGRHGGSRALGNWQLSSADAGLPVQEQLRKALTRQAVRVIDLFREWDENGDGRVTKKEFRRAMGMLGLEAPRTDVDLVFDSFDPVPRQIPTAEAPRPTAGLSGPPPPPSPLLRGRMARARSTTMSSGRRSGAR